MLISDQVQVISIDVNTSVQLMVISWDIRHDQGIEVLINTANVHVLLPPIGALIDDDWTQLGWPLFVWAKFSLVFLQNGQTRSEDRKGQFLPLMKTAK